MFDLNFYSSVLGYYQFHEILKHDPDQIFFSASKTTKEEHLMKIKQDLDILLECKYFTYYMKKHFKYFNFNLKYTNM